MVQLAVHRLQGVVGVNGYLQAAPGYPLEWAVVHRPFLDETIHFEDRDRKAFDAEGIFVLLPL